MGEEVRIILIEETLMRWGFVPQTTTTTTLEEEGGALFMPESSPRLWPLVFRDKLILLIW